MNGDDLVPDELEDAIDDRLKALQDLLVRECHVTFFNASLGEFGLDTDIDGPLLAIVAEISLYPVLKVHDALGVDFSSRLGAIRQLHLPYLCAENVAEITVQGCGTARVTGSCCAFGHGEWLFLLDLVSDQIDGTTTTINNQNSIVNLEVE